MKFIDLKKASRDVISQYVTLRNHYYKELKTKQVTVEETLFWLKQANVLAIGLLEDEELLGAAIVYMDRENELAAFTKVQGKGLGQKLFRYLEIAGPANGISELWARVDINNNVANRLLEKCGCTLVREEGEIAYFRKYLRTPEPEF